MTSGSDIGAYMLGASIAKSHAKSEADFREHQAQVEFNKKIAKQRRRADENYDLFAYEGIRSAARRIARCRSDDAAEALALRADRERLTSADIRAAFAHELDNVVSLKNMIEDGKEAARIWISEQTNPANIEAIRQALARFVADHEKRLADRTKT
jgi:hypothetical protein